MTDEDRIAVTNNTQTPVGLTKNAGWQIGLRRTLSVPAQVLWDFMLSQDGLEIWLGMGEPFKFIPGIKYKLFDGTTGEVRVIDKGSQWRISRKPANPRYERPSTIQVRIIDKADQCTLAFHEEHLPDERSRKIRKTFYLNVMELIKDRLEAD